jgi:leucyl-tRNA synthetase
LPDDVDFEPTGEPPLSKSAELQNRTEEIFGEGWRPETETMDTFVDSSWYFLRFTDPHNPDTFAKKEKIETWMPVDLYMGGAEHTVLHLLYARFITKVLNDLDFVDFREPFAKLRHQGMILAEDGRKMSKSLGNVVNPTDVIEQFGADSIRLYEMFLGPLADDTPWQTDSIVGVRRFLEKVWRLQDQLQDTASQAVESKLHKTIKKVTEDTEALRFNTAIAAMMECANMMEQQSITEAQYEKFVRLLAPYAPHITEELWYTALDMNSSVHTAEWPRFDKKKTQQTQATIAVQIDGEVRGEITVDVNASKESVIKQARSQTGVARRLEGKPVHREIYVEGEIVNFVTHAA